MWNPSPSIYITLLFGSFIMKIIWWLTLDALKSINDEGLLVILMALAARWLMGRGWDADIIVRVISGSSQVTSLKKYWYGVHKRIVSNIIPQSKVIKIFYPNHICTNVVQVKFFWTRHWPHYQQKNNIVVLYFKSISSLFKHARLNSSRLTHCHLPHRSCFWCRVKLPVVPCSWHIVPWGSFTKTRSTSSLRPVAKCTGS